MAASSRPSCPRCGYDLRGDTDSWNHVGSGSCPVRGRCSECGLEFDWADIYNPFRSRVRGFIEHEDRGLYRAAWRTWAMTGRPWRFWKLVKIEFEPRLGRAVLWLVLLLVPAWAIGAIVTNGVQVYLDVVARPGPLKVWTMKGALVAWMEGLVVEEYTPTGVHFACALKYAPAFVVGPLAASIVVPLVLLCLPHTRKLARVRAAHVVRAAIYGQAWLLPVILLKSVNQAAVATTWMVWMSMGARGQVPASIRLYNTFSLGIHRTWLLWLTIALVWEGMWWWFTLSIGWRVGEYKKVMRALIIIGLLAAAAAVFLSNDGYRVFM